MLFSKLRDYKLRKLLSKSEQKSRIFKFIYFSSLLKVSNSSPIALRQVVILSKKKYFFQSNKIKLIKRCLLNNRSKSVIKPFNISRLLFRNMLQYGLIPGYKKAVW